MFRHGSKNALIFYSERTRKYASSIKDLLILEEQFAVYKLKTLHLGNSKLKGTVV